MSDPTDAAAEIAKATGEVAKTARRPVDALSKAIAMLLHPGTKQLGEVIGETLAELKFTRRVKRAERFLAFQRRHPMAKAVELPEGFVLSFFDNVAHVDNEALVQLWDNLLNNAYLDPDFARQQYIEMLKQLGVEDAKILEMIARNDGQIMGVATFSPKTGIRNDRCWLSVDKKEPLREFKVQSFDNLERLGLVAEKNNWPKEAREFADIQLGKARHLLKTSYQSEFRFVITALGRAFHMACVAPTAKMANS